MRTRQVLQLSALLMGLCCLAVPAGKIPTSQLEMLALGLAHLLEAAEDDVRSLEQQGDLVVKELYVATKNLESLRRQSSQAARTHRQVRKDLQIQTASDDRLSRAIRDLQKEVEDLDSEQGSIQLQMNRIIQSLRSLKEPRSKPDATAVKVLIDNQARRLVSLTAEVSAQDRIINRRLRQVEHLETSLSSAFQQQRATTTPVEPSCINKVTEAAHQLPKERFLKSTTGRPSQKKETSLQI
ncbi:uncharacterized protein V3H82_026833 [Fundulus diaphanus]